MKFPSVRTALAGAALAAALAGCSSSAPPRYYTLSVPAADAAPRVQAGYLIDVLPVSVPAQADQPQLMVRMEEGSVAALYGERWAAPLAEEIRDALSDALKRDLGALDVRTVKPAANAPVWRVQADVQGFDLVAGSRAQLDATWRVRPLNTAGEGRLCRSLVVENVDGEGAPALVAAQRRAVAALGGAMAAAIRGGTEDAGSSVRTLGCTALPRAQGENPA